MNSRKVKEIVKFSIQKNIQNKWFIIFNVITLLIIIATTNIENIKFFLESRNIHLFDENICVEILDKNNLATDKIIEAFENENFEIKEITENTYDKNTIPDDLVVLEITESETDLVTAKLISKDSMGSFIYDEITGVLTQVRSELFAEKNKIDTQALEKLNEPVKIEEILLSVDTENSDTKEIIKTVSTLIIYFVSILVFSKIANEIAQEKVSKSIEYVLTSVTEKEYLLAKIISVNGIILIQGIYLLIYYFIGNLVNNILNISAFQAIDTTLLTSGIDTSIILYIITVLGYGILTLILMSIIQAALSSKTVSMNEAGNTTALLTTITILAYIITLSVITPYTKMNALLYVLSCIPLLSNYFIPAIMVIGQATTLQIIISLVLLIISIPITFNICATIFKNGVLDYKPTKNKKVKKSKKQLTFEEEQNLDLTKKKYRKLGFVVGMAIIIYLTLSTLLSFIIPIFISPFLNNYLNEEQVGYLANSLLSIIALGLSSMFVLAYSSKYPKTTKVSFKTATKFIFEGICLLMLFQIGLSYIYEFIGIDYNIANVVAVSDSSNVLTNILYFVFIAVIPAIFEELLFRKALITASRKFGNVFAVVFSALLFGFIHMNLGQFIFAFLIGLVFGWIYVKTDDIRIPIILHLINNGFAASTTIIENEIILIVISAIILLSTIIGFISISTRLLQSIKNKELKINLKFNKEEIQNCKYLLTDYTFIIALIFTALQFVLTEYMLRNIL